MKIKNILSMLVLITATFFSNSIYGAANCKDADGNNYEIEIIGPKKLTCFECEMEGSYPNYKGIKYVLESTPELPEGAVVSWKSSSGFFLVDTSQTPGIPQSETRLWPSREATSKLTATITFPGMPESQCEAELYVVVDIPNRFSGTITTNWLNKIASVNCSDPIYYSFKGNMNLNFVSNCEHLTGVNILETAFIGDDSVNGGCQLLSSKSNSLNSSNNSYIHIRNWQTLVGSAPSTIRTTTVEAYYQASDQSSPTLIQVIKDTLQSYTYETF